MNEWPVLEFPGRKHSRLGQTPELSPAHQFPVSTTGPRLSIIQSIATMHQSLPSRGCVFRAGEPKAHSGIYRSQSWLIVRIKSKLGQPTRGTATEQPCREMRFSEKMLYRETGLPSQCHAQGKVGATSIPPKTSGNEQHSQQRQDTQPSFKRQPSCMPITSNLRKRSRAPFHSQ